MFSPFRFFFPIITVLLLIAQWLDPELGLYGWIVLSIGASLHSLAIIRYRSGLHKLWNSYFIMATIVYCTALIIFMM
ncbi:MAG: hypothetical protein ACRC5C_02820 [Bacilli bacterium]